MLNQFSEWVKGFSDGGTAVPCEDEAFVTTITALLVEAGMADGDLDDAERDGILHLLTEQLGLQMTRQRAFLMRRLQRMIRALKFTALFARSAPKPKWMTGLSFWK